RLTTHLKRGGGLVICLGPHVDAEAYNRLLYRDGDGILPAKLIGAMRAPADNFFTLAADEEQFRKPPLAAFAADSARASLMSARFRQYTRVEIPSKSAARRFLNLIPPDRIEDTAAKPTPLDPLVVEWSRHRGRVILIASTVNTDWSGWPLSPSFPP